MALMDRINATKVAIRTAQSEKDFAMYVEALEKLEAKVPLHFIVDEFDFVHDEMAPGRRLVTCKKDSLRHRAIINNLLYPKQRVAIP